MPWLIFAVAGFVFVGSVAFTRLFIEQMRRSGNGQPIREYGPTIHEHKRGTPTMGGLVILIVFLVGAGAYHALHGPLGLAVWTLIGATGAFGLIGLLDDLLKFTRQRSEGLAARYKLLLQGFVVVGVLTALGLQGALETALRIPFMGDSEAGFTTGLIAGLALLGTVNAMNLTDGLDGLAGGITLFILGAYGLITQEFFPVIALFGASLLGFLVFNVHPAQIFLGDTGSMALGGFIGTLSALTGTELFLLIFAVVPVAEALSVMIQVPFYKLTGRRVFKVSPLHHHFERAGGVDYDYWLPDAEWPEWAITLVFWGVTVLFALIGLWAYFHVGR